MTYDNNLLELQQKVALKKQLESKLNDLREQRKVYDKQVIELRVAHRSEQEDVAALAMETLHKRLLAALPPQVQISDPLPAPLAKAYGQFRYQCTLKAPSSRIIADTCSREITGMHCGEGVVISLDIDAYSFM